MLEFNKLYYIHCLDGLGQLPDDSIDLLTTDPPYGLSFMGKDWDKAVPPIDVWKGCLRVLKPGSFAFIMCIPRQDCLSRMIVNLDDAGFNTGFTSIYWTYASGFPKAGNISKLVDKRWKKKTEYDKLAEYLKNARCKIGFSRKEMAKVFPSKTGGLTGCIWNWENGVCVPTQEQWLKLKNKLNLNDEFDWLIEQETKRYEEAKREVIGKEKRKGKPPQPMWKETDGQKWDVTIPATSQAKDLDGSYAGFQPKPAIEIIIVAMKPLSEKTYVDQALKNKKGITWLGDCKIPYILKEDQEGARYGTQADIKGANLKGDKKPWGVHGKNILASSNGRFPANLLVSDDMLNDGKKWKAGGNVTGDEPSQPTKNVYDEYERVAWQSHGDSGSYSRYFDLDAWFNKQMAELSLDIQNTFPFIAVPKASTSEKNKGLENLDDEDTRFFRSHGGSGEPIGISKTYPNGTGRPQNKMKNFHPTVKPLKLMSYLVVLGSREEDVVLDPYIGSGTTGLACKLLNRKYIGFENNTDYYKIAQARLSADIRKYKVHIDKKLIKHDELEDEAPEKDYSTRLDDFI